MRAKSLLILCFILVTPSCILRRTKQDRQCSYNIIFWLIRVTIVSNDTQQCVVFVLLSYVSLSVNIEHCKTVLLWTIYVAGKSINLFRCSCKVPAISCQILTKFGVSGQLFIKILNIKLCVNPSIGSRADTCEQTDGHDEANRLFFFRFLCERA